MLVENVAIAPHGFLVYLVVVAVDHHDAHTVFGSQQQSVMYGKQGVECLCRTAHKQVAAQGDVPDIHLAADVQRLPPVGHKFRDIIF